jgi:hypothetical protein
MSVEATEIIRSSIISKDLPSSTGGRLRRPLLYSEDEIVRMAFEIPFELTPETTVQTLAGRWHMEEGRAVFEFRDSKILKRIIKPPLRERASKITKAVFQMSDPNSFPADETSG